MGNESEFGMLGGWSEEKVERIQRALLSEPNMASAKKRGGVFLGNGGRAYIDVGQNEYATPETESPFDLVAREMAGRALMQLAANTEGVSLLCSNFDYATGNSWGNHENYECSREPSEQAFTQLYTHLISRVIVTGGGGIDPKNHGVRLILSPRVTTMKTALNWSGSMKRSLVYEKDDHHGHGYRLHVFCGEGLLSHTASLLRYGTTALVTMLVDQKKWTGPSNFRQSPVRELKRLNCDIHLKTKFELENGSRFSALEIQWGILEEVAQHLKDLPDWAASVIEIWERVLSQLENGNPKAADTLDWLIYRDAVWQLAEEHGLEPEQLHRADCHDDKVTELRAAACELYVRLHALGRESLFQKLEFKGAIKHRLPQVPEARIVRAIDAPPAGRAANRAALIRRFGNDGRFAVSWEYVVATENSAKFPIPTKPVPDWEDVLAEIPVETKARRNQSAERLFRQGRYLETIKLDASRAGGHSCDPERLGLSYARLGMREETVGILATMHSQWDEFFHLAETLSCTSNFGLTPPVAELEPLVKRGDAMKPQLLGEQADSYSRFIFLQYKALYLLHVEDYAAAAAIFERLLDEKDNRCRPRMYARTRCMYAELLRRRGNAPDALAMANAGLEIHQERGLEGDLADFSLPLLAKLEQEAGSARFLNTAEAIQREFGNKLGLARVLCLRARLLRNDRDKPEIMRLLGTLPILLACPTALRIANNWDEWINPDLSFDPMNYWGL